MVTGEMALQLRVLATLPEDLAFIPNLKPKQGVIHNHL